MGALARAQPRNVSNQGHTSARLASWSRGTYDLRSTPPAAAVYGWIRPVGKVGTTVIPRSPRGEALEHELRRRPSWQDSPSMRGE
jgi:hypothetical protein